MAVTAVIVLFCTSSCGRTSNAAAQERPQDRPREAPTVAAARAAFTDLSRDITLSAEFRPFQEVDVMAKVAGYVRSIQVDAGDRVKQGQLLATLEIPEMADDEMRATAALERSQSEVARARDELQRAESVHQMAHLSHQRLFEVTRQRPGLLAQQEVDDAHSKDLVAEAQVAAAKSSLAAAQQQVQVSTAELQKLRTLFEYTRITAPFDGVVTRRFADTGAMVQAGTASNALPLVKLSQNSQLRLILPVPESAVPSVHIGQQVSVRVPTLNRSFSGRVARFAERVMSSTRTMDTEVDVPNPSLLLIPGMFAEVKLTLDQKPHALSVPVSAVDLGSDETSGQVLLVNPENRLEFRKVQLGLQSATLVEVRQGLAKGDPVVLANRASLRAGESVRPKFTEPAAGSQP